MQENENTKIERAIQAATKSGRFFCKFVSANDVGLTGAHQEGIYLSKDAWDLFFPGVERIRGTNIENLIRIHLDGHYRFESRLIYYGQGTRNEYRITRFWTNSPFQKEQHIGDLIIFIPLDPDNFYIYLLDTDKEIESFIEHFSLSLINNSATYTALKGQENDLARTLEEIIEEKAKKFTQFPDTTYMAEVSRVIFEQTNKVNTLQPDKDILKWIETEYALFRAIERNVYKSYLDRPFGELEPLLNFASSALNRRKSRAGKSLEHHIDFMFRQLSIPFSHPGRSEGNKKPDFLLPSNEAYAEYTFDNEKLIFLGAKTTCKDRWRQVLNEASRIPQKHLFTLQQGITINQLDEMQEVNLTLVVPEPLHKFYPKSHQHRIWTVQEFINYAKEKYRY